MELEYLYNDINNFISLYQFLDATGRGRKKKAQAAKKFLKFMEFRGYQGIILTQYLKLLDEVVRYDLYYCLTRTLK